MSRCRPVTQFGRRHRRLRLAPERFKGNTGETDHLSAGESLLRELNYRGTGGIKEKQYPQAEEARGKVPIGGIFSATFAPWEKLNLPLPGTAGKLPATLPGPLSVLDYAQRSFSASIQRRLTIRPEIVRIIFNSGVERNHALVVRMDSVWIKGFRMGRCIPFQIKENSLIRGLNF